MNPILLPGEYEVQTSYFDDGTSTITYYGPAGEISQADWDVLFPTLHECCGCEEEPEPAPEPVERVVDRFTATGPGTVSAGFVAVSFHNHGASDAVVLGQILGPGETVSYAVDAPDILGAVAYDGTGTDLQVTTIL